MNALLGHPSHKLEDRLDAVEDFLAVYHHPGAMTVNHAKHCIRGLKKDLEAARAELRDERSLNNQTTFRQITNRVIFALLIWPLIASVSGATSVWLILAWTFAAAGAADILTHPQKAYIAFCQLRRMVRRQITKAKQRGSQ